MINWIVGGLVIGFTLYIIATTVIRIRKGENSCSGCCSESKKAGCGCDKK
ncbi:MAG: hypothetical protein ACOYWZ_12315 [Bacillota bacterium]